ncbi:MAG: hypothetical protein LUE98_09420 [Tannerellaceae bacterium]|nr:hypothetical protein [Tannerellaceae bacterium]
MTTIYEDAVKAYEKYCTENNLIFRLPSENASEIDRDFVYLKNNYEDLAEYEIATEKIIV